MENVVAVVLFDLAFLVPPFAVVLGFVMLALPSRARKVASRTASAHAA
jgi:hypothetical protein